MTETPRKASGSWQLGYLMWLSLGLFAVFFVNVVIQRFHPGLLDIAAVQEAALLVVATGIFISACLRLESRDAHTE